MIRYQIFISSTQKDLIAERQAVSNAIQSSGHIPAGMELFTADDNDSWRVIQREIDDSDYYVLIIAGRYGSITEEGISFTEKEYDYAFSKEIPIFAFFHADVESLPAKNVERHAVEKLDEFRAKVEGRHQRLTWNGKEDLALKVISTLSKQFSIRPRSGWVRGEIVHERLLLQKECDELRTQVETLSKSNYELESKIAVFASNTPYDDDSIARDDDLFHLDLVDREKSADTLDPVKYPITWKKLFDLVASFAISEVNRTKLNQVISAYINLSHPNMEVGVKLDIASGSLDAIGFQFMALEWIDIRREKVSHKVGKGPFSVYSNEDYWVLTSKGRRKFALQKAVRK